MSRRGVVVVLAAVALLAGCTSTIAGHPTAAGPTGFPSSSGSTPSADPNGGAAAEPAPTGVVVGPSSAPVQVALYEDLGCPPCARFGSAFEPVLQAELATGKVAVHFYDVAFLDREFAGTRYSTRAANAALCAGQLGPSQFLAVHAALLAHQPAEGSAGHTDAELVAIAQRAGVSGPDFASCVTGRRYVGSVTSATRAATNVGVTGVPAMFVGASPVSPLTAANARAAIDRAR